MISNIKLEISEHCLCLIEKYVMTDPVLAADGQTYQRESFLEWLRIVKSKSPLTGDILPYTTLYENIFANNVIRYFLERRPEVEFKEKGINSS